VFALLGPVVAIASLADTALQARRTLRRERRRFATEIAKAHATTADEHGRERAALTAQHRDARALMRAPRRDPERWRATLDVELPVVLGAGSRRSAIMIEGERTSGRSPEHDEWSGPLDALREAASTLVGAPVVVDARAGIGIQLAAALSPDEHEIVAAPGGGTGWLAQLPHSVTWTESVAESILFRSRSSASHR